MNPLTLVLIGNRAFVGRMRTPVLPTGTFHLEDCAEAMQVMTQRGDMAIAGNLLGDMEIQKDSNTLIIKLSHKSPYAIHYLKLTTGIVSG